MGNFEKKDIIKEAENILIEYTKKDIEEKKKITKLKNDYKRIKRTNIALKILIGIMTLAMFIIII